MSRSAKRPRNASTQWTWPLVGIGARLVVGGVFLAAGLVKAIAPPQDFAAALETYRILPQALTLPAAWLLPWMELLTGLSLVTGYRVRYASGAAGVLLIIFMGSIFSALARHLPLTECGCYGPWIQISPRAEFGWDFAFLLLLFPASRHGARWLSLDSWIDRGAPSTPSRQPRK